LDPLLLDQGGRAVPRGDRVRLRVHNVDREVRPSDSPGPVHLFIEELDRLRHVRAEEAEPARERQECPDRGGGRQGRRIPTWNSGSEYRARKPDEAAREEDQEENQKTGWKSHPRPHGISPDL